MMRQQSMASLRSFALIGLLVPLQVAFFSQMTFGGISPDVLMVVALGTGMLAGPERGAVVGFVAGLAYDLFLVTPIGLSALVYSVMAYGIGMLQPQLLSHPRWWQVSSVAVGSALAAVLWWVTAVVIGREDLLGLPVTRIALVMGLVNAIVALPVFVGVRWAVSPLVEPRTL